jgi:hypothetical protein
LISDWAVTGIANLTFTPGVDGDFAYPTIFFSSFSSNSDSISASNGFVEFSFTDNATEDSTPTARTEIYQQIEIQLNNDENQFGKLDLYDAVFFR